MAAVEFQLSRQMIDWIASVGRTSTVELAEQLMPKKQDKFLNGLVTKSTAEKLAKIGQVPFGYLFLETPPEFKKATLPDFRQTSQSTHLTRDFTDTYEDIEYKLNWYKEYLQDFGITHNLSFIGRFNLRDNVEDVARDISETIHFDINKALKLPNKDAYFSFVSKLVESIGVLVFKNGIVKSNTKRKIDINEFRGFCIIDPIAPAIFVNGGDVFSAQVFTLFHELAHLWIGKEGVSNWTFENKIEAYCNKVAAEILMPAQIFKREWDKEYAEDLDIFYVVDIISKYFKVSSFATAVRAKTLKLIDDDTFLIIRERSSSATKKDSSGANPYAVYPYRNSQSVTDAVLASAMSQRLPLREASNLLNIKPNTVIELYRKRNSL